MMRMLLLILSILLLGTLIWLINPDWMKWFAVALPGWVRWIGGGIVVAGLVLLIWTHQTLGTSFSGNLEIREQHKLVTTGPYRWVRHPMYSAILLWATGLSLITANWFVGLVPLAFSLFFIGRVLNEEKMMMEGFGDEYGSYIGRTRRFLPRVIH